MGGAVIIDDAGRVWPAQTRALQHGLGNRQQDFDFPSYAVRNLGFVRIDFPAPASQCVTFRPDMVAPQAVIGAFFTMTESRPRRIALRYFARDREAPAGDPWHYELVSDSTAALHRIEDLINAAVQHRPSAGYLAVRRPLDEVTQVAAGRLAGVLKIWREASGVWQPRLLEVLQRREAPERMMVARIQSADSQVVVHAAVGSYSCAQHWYGDFSAGQDLAALPDREFGARIASTYRGVAESEEPRLDYVDTEVRLSETEVRRFRYERLVMPWQLDGDDRLVLSTSVYRGTLVKG